jgi:hypothetical protein
VYSNERPSQFTSLHQHITCPAATAVRSVGAGLLHRRHADGRPGLASARRDLRVRKAVTVAKLRGARERKRRETGKCEGRKSHAERDPELVALAKRLHRQKPKAGRMSLRAISAELATQGFLNENGRPFAAASVKSMLN